MFIKQSSQLKRSYLAKQKRLINKKRRFVISLCLCCLLLGGYSFPLETTASGELFTTDDRNIPSEAKSPSEETPAFTRKEGKPNERSKGYILLDPGHGGEDSPGSVYGGILEQDVTLDLSLFTRDQLAERGYTVEMTREEDKTVPIEKRTEMANKSGADLLLSIHLNAHEDSDVFGIETWFNSKTNTKSSALAQYVQQAVTTSTKGKDRGVYPDTSLILTREALIPSCIVEVGYLSNVQEREKMLTEAYSKKIAQGIADGVEQYFRKFPSTQPQANGSKPTGSTTSETEVSEHIDKSSSEEEKLIYLTFDDGPSSNTEKILDILDQYRIKGTFFVTGLNQDYKHLIKETANRGHTIGLHTYSHDYEKIYGADEAFFADLGAIGSLVKEEIGFVPKYLRFPGGTSNTVSNDPGLMDGLARKVQHKGYEYYDWCADSGDASSDPTVDSLVTNATDCDWNEITLLLHDANGKDTTVEALPEIIETYLARGYHFAAITDETTPVHHEPQS